MKAEILSVGTELLLGHITDTNAPYLAQSLNDLGIDVFWISQVGDNRGRLVDQLRRAWRRSELIVCTGGIGPTDDDLTREGISDLVGERMEVQPELAEELRGFFARRGVAMPERNIKQATKIPSCTILHNPIGTAPGWLVEKEGHIIVAMPGVPVEMKRMWENEVLPKLRERQGGAIILTRTLKVVGVGESAVEDMIRHLIPSLNPTLATYAKADGVHIRVTSKAQTREEAQRLLDEMEPRVREVMGVNIYGVNNETLEGVVGKLLLERGYSLATMESCTGGLLSDTITNVPGASHYFRGGCVAYSNELKIALGVDPMVIEQYGAVSAETAVEMAKAARARTGADVALATTGVAGPDGLEGKKPGTLHIGLDCCGQTKAVNAVAGAPREVFKRRATLYSLNLLRRFLIEGK